MGVIGLEETINTDFFLPIKVTCIVNQGTISTIVLDLRLHPHQNEETHLHNVILRKNDLLDKIDSDAFSALKINLGQPTLLLDRF